MNEYRPSATSGYPLHTDKSASHDRGTDDFVALADLFKTILARFYIVILCGLVFAFLGLIYAVFATPVYTAAVTARPIESSSQNSIPKQLSGAAALVGVNLNRETSNSVEYAAILESREFGQKFLSEENVMPHLFPNMWDWDKAAWKELSEPGPVGKLKRSLRAFLATTSGDKGYRPPSAQPTLWRGFNKLRVIRSISKDDETGIIKVSFTFDDPQLAAQWANSYIAKANAQIRADAIAESERAIAFLQEEIVQTDLQGLRDTVLFLLQSQLENKMLAEARPEYAFKIIDPAFVPEQRMRPSRLMLLIVSLFFGLTIGIVMALIWSWLKSRAAALWLKRPWASKSAGKSEKIKDLQKNEAA